MRAIASRCERRTRGRASGGCGDVTPAWRSRPVWAVLPTADRCIDPGVHHFSYERMGATVTEIEGASHVVMISHPKEVAQVVMTAARASAS
jgi:pimeloyl-ACP methyl ester carboxylesterase